MLAERVSSSRVVVVAGLAEIAAASIDVGLGGFLAVRSDAEHYEQEMRSRQCPRQGRCSKGYMMPVSGRRI